MDWAAATSATVRLTVGGTVIGTVTGANTSAYRVEAVALGMVASTGGTSGAAAIDSYVSTRYTLP